MPWDGHRPTVHNDRRTLATSTPVSERSAELTLDCGCQLIRTICPPLVHGPKPVLGAMLQLDT